MAYALRGSLGTVATGTTTVTPSFAQATAAGNLLIAWVSSANGGSLSTSSSGWNRISGAGFVAGVFYKANCSASETAPTFSTSAGLTIFAALAEFTGGATSSPLDKSQAITSSFSASTVIACAAVDSASGELFVSASTAIESKAGTTTTTDTYNNATPTGNLNNDAASIAVHYRFSYGITTSKAAPDQNTFADSSMNFTLSDLVVASFILAAGATTYTKAGYAKENG